LVWKYTILTNVAGSGDSQDTEWKTYPQCQVWFLAFWPKKQKGSSTSYNAPVHQFDVCPAMGF
jgi:hypothetical protein